MNILYVGSPQLFKEGASSIHVAKMCEAFAMLNHNVELILPIDKSQLDSFFGYYNIHKKFKINPTVGFSSGSLRHFIHGVLSLFKLFSVKKYDYIVTRNLLFAYLASFFYSKIIIDIHHPPINYISKLAIKRFLLSKNIFKISCNSEGTKDSLVKTFFPSSKLEVLHNGVNVETFKPQKNLSQFKKCLQIPEDYKVVSYVGNTYKGRGIEKIVELSKTNKDIFFLVVGGEDEDNREYEKDVLNNQANILFTGHVNNIEIPNFLAISDVLLIPYTSDFTIKGGSKAFEYSSPIKLFEYLSAGKPIIASNLPSISRILSNGQNSLLVEPDSTEDLNDKLKKLLGDHELSKEISENSLKLSKEFTWVGRARRMLLAKD